MTPQTTEKQALPAAPPAELFLTLGVDGRVYCHDLAPELLDVLRAIGATDLTLEQRCGVLRNLEKLS